MSDDLTTSQVPGSTANRPVVSIHGVECWWLLASSEADARAWLTAEGLHPATQITSAGWARNIGWDHWEYDSRDDFRDETGLDAWWEIGVLPPADDREATDLRRAWRIG